ncbi:MAG: hypothetical protein JXR70_08495 [Spirochaetales bacterium]|nr:hypothetical protein [Spirochaetales bacterium]
MYKVNANEHSRQRVNTNEHSRHKVNANEHSCQQAINTEHLWPVQKFLEAKAEAAKSTAY